MAVTTLGEEFPKEQQRLRELIEAYRQIPASAFGRMVIEDVLQRADRAVISGDVVAMIKSYKEMKGCE